MIKAVIFDCFGVLVDEGSLLRKKPNKELFRWIYKNRSKYLFGLLSSTSREWLDCYIDEKNQAYFQAIMLSSEMPTRKPNPDAYNATAAQLNTPTRQCLFVDDSEVNLSGAEAVGMQTLLYKNFRQFEQDIKERLR